MARIFTTGCELGVTSEFNGSANLTVSTAAVRTGVYAYRGNNESSTQTFAANLTELYLRLAFRFDSFSAGGTLVAFRDEDAAAQISVAFNAATQNLTVVRGASVIATGTAIIALSTWYVLEGHFVLSDTVGAAVVKINGVTDISFSGDTVATAKPSVRSMVIGSGGWIAFWDDIAVNDTTGSYQNSWIGTGGVYLLRPTAEGGTVMWTKSAGTSHWQLVDEVPYNTTDYVYSSVLADRDMFTLSDLPAQVLTVSLIEPVFTVALAEAGINNIKHAVSHGGTVYYGSTAAVTTVTPNFVLYKSAPIYTALGGTALWTPAQVNALESGFEVA